MKKVLLALLVLILLIVGGLAIFIATFDADRYRPFVVGKLQDAIKHPVSLEHMALGWRGGLALQLKGLTIADQIPSAEPLIHVDSADAVVRLAPLLHQDVQITAIVLKSLQAHISRDAQGQINLLGLAVAGAPAAAPSQTAPGTTPLALEISSFRIDDGAVHWTDAMTRPPTDLVVKDVDLQVRNIAAGRPMDVTLAASIGAASRNLHVAGRLTLPGPSAPGSIEQLTVKLNRMGLDHVLPKAAAGEPQLHGTITASVQGKAATLDPQQVMQAVSASGRLQLTDAKIENLNLLRAVFERISMVPGLMAIIETQLPPEYQAKFAAKDTVLQPIDAGIEVERGALQFQDLTVTTDAFALSGHGVVALSGGVNIQAVLRVERTLSAALILKTKELQGIANSAGELEIPLTIQGQLPRLVPMPDVAYLTSRLLANKFQDVVGGLLQRALERHTTPDQPAAAPAQ
ncbi:MAG: AsmA family protein [Candidatus Omnitrophica bacterium]|nr:AsmA family protein [Candidatus Omnitrophota bacterium]